MSTPIVRPSVQTGEQPIRTARMRMYQQVTQERVRVQAYQATIVQGTVRVLQLPTAVHPQRQPVRQEAAALQAAILQAAPVHPVVRVTLPAQAQAPVQAVADSAVAVAAAAAAAAAAVAQAAAAVVADDQRTFGEHP